MAEQPIVVKKVVKKGHGHHGGAWKLAYADFVTAMMAFFLLMWLLGSTDEVTKKGISEYFQDPYEASKIDKGKVPTLDEIDPTELDKQSEQEDKMKLEALKLKIEKMIKENENLAQYKEQIQLTTTPEGLRVQLTDDKKKPMFKSGKAETEEEMRTILRALAPVINGLPNKISINGHTDSKPFPEFSKQYTNWELSSQRANAARYELNQGGLAAEKILRVSGLADSVPYNEKDAQDPMNRRISIIVMNKKSEQKIIEETGNKHVKTKEELANGKEPASEQGKPAETPKEGKASEAAGSHEADKEAKAESPAEPKANPEGETPEKAAPPSEEEPKATEGEAKH